MPFFSLRKIIDQYCPPFSFSFFKQEISRYPFVLSLVKSRASKFGDFRLRSNESPVITINNNLNSYLFLFTFLHELAHLHTYRRFGRTVKPHGSEWKIIFKDLLLIAVRYDVFPSVMIKEVLAFISKPKASASASPDLLKAFSRFDKKYDNKSFLDDIPDGTKFLFKGRIFIKREKRRTRILCSSIDEKQIYLISGLARVLSILC